MAIQFIAAETDRQLRNLDGRTVQCPICSSQISVTPVQVEGRVLDTGSSTDRQQLFNPGRYSIFIPEQNVASSAGYLITNCAVCGTFILVLAPAQSYSLTTAVWPLANVSVSEHVPEPVSTAVKDAKLALAVGSITGAIMSARTAIERIWKKENTGSISELWAAKDLSPSLFDSANEPRLWANVITHADFDPEDVTSEHVQDLLEFLDFVLRMVYIMPEELRLAREAREQL